jgi:hypothetical protein
MRVECYGVKSDPLVERARDETSLRELTLSREKRKWSSEQGEDRSRECAGQSCANLNLIACKCDFERAEHHFHRSKISVQCCDYYYEPFICDALHKIKSRQSALENIIKQVH